MTKKTLWNLYFRKRPAEHVRSLYYVGDEDGVWPAKLEQRNGRTVPVRTSNIMLPYDWMRAYITIVKPQGMSNDLRTELDPVEEKQVQQLLDDWEIKH